MEGALAIAEALKSNSTLKYLELSNVYGYLIHYNIQGNKIEVEGALAIAEALKLKFNTPDTRASEQQHWSGGCHGHG